MGGYLFYLFRHREALAELEEGEKHEEDVFKSLAVAWLFLFLGIGMIFLGAKSMVDNVVTVAERLNISQGIIAATIVAFGTSVPGTGSYCYQHSQRQERYCSGQHNRQLHF